MKSYVTGFLCVLLGALAGCATWCGDAEVEVDPNLTVFLSDIHIQGGKESPRHQNALFEACVDEIEKLRPRPARAVIFGDIACFYGRAVDYAAARPLLARLERLMPVTFTTGNHDHRAALSAAFPRPAAASPVPGRFASVVDLGGADLLLLDTLHETAPADGWNKGDGEIGKEQCDWLLAEAKRRTRPFFVGAHHAPTDITDRGREAVAALAANPRFAGWIHGHDHFWRKGLMVRGWNDSALNRRPFRVTCLPSSGYWGDIGFVLARTLPDGAELRNVERDFFFLNPLKPGEKRPDDWNRYVRENDGDTVRIYWPPDGRRAE